MTNNRAREIIKQLIADEAEQGDIFFTDEDKEALDLAIKALEQNGTPVSTEGDLISRSALIREIGRTDEWYKGHSVCNIIDNAPTVEPTIKPICEVKFNKEQMQELVDKAKAEVLASIERPQGEWIDYNNTFYKCPECGYLLEKCCPQCQNKVILPKGGAV